MMHMPVSNPDQWWARISALGLESRYDIRVPIPPRLEPWTRVAYVFDPSGILWHFAEGTAGSSAARVSLSPAVTILEPDDSFGNPDE